MAKVALVETAPPESAPAAPAHGGKRKLIVVIVLLLVLAGGGFAAWKFLGQNAGDNAEKLVVAQPPVFVPVDQFTVNLNPEGGEQFLQTAFTLQVTDQEVVEVIKQRAPDLRNQVLLLLSSKKAADLTSVEGKQKLAGEIMALANAVIVPAFPVAKKPADAKAKDGERAKAKDGEHAKTNTPAHAVTGVLFTHFIIQ